MHLISERQNDSLRRQPPSIYIFSVVTAMVWTNVIIHPIIAVVIIIIMSCFLIHLYRQEMASFTLVRTHMSSVVTAKPLRATTFEVA